jgi:hypothetical protein
MLTSHSVRHLCNLVLLGLALLAGDAWATCYPEGGTKTCSSGYCKGITTCDVYWGPCEFTGESTGPCTVCGRSGTRRCDSNGNLLGSTCTAYRAADDICNGCDDDGDGQVDEDYVPSGTCDPQQNGCLGKYHCINGQLACRVTVGTQWLSCADTCDGYSAKRWCKEDGTLGPCIRDTVAPESCNGCDDDRDGTVDNAPNQGPSTLTRSCIGPGGACPGSTEACVNGSWSGVCTAPPEVCNGLDDDCDGSIDESNVCRADSLACSCTPTTCAAQGRSCGTLPDGCGGTLSCGACGSGQMCNNNVCVSTSVPAAPSNQGNGR